MNLVLVLFGIYSGVLLQIDADSCGHRNDSSWKWHVLLFNTQLMNQHSTCGGTLLNKLFVATAAHCLYDLNGALLNIAHLQLIFTDGERRSVKRTFHHKPFDIESISNDFVLLMLDREVEFNNLVAPVCLPKADEIPTHNVTTPLHTSEALPANGESVCLNDAQILFGMTYDDAMCLGTFDHSYKYQRNAGSGMFVEHNSKWYLVGVIMYTTGPTKDHIAYMGGIRLERFLEWFKITVDHYSKIQSIAEEECQSYMRGSSIPFKEYHPIVNLVDKTSPRTICHGALISPRFVMTTTQCAEKSKRVFLHYGSPNRSDWFTNDKYHIEPMDNKIALIELGRDAQDIQNLTACLYSSSARHESANFTTRIAHTDSFVRLEGIRVQYRTNAPLTVLYYCSRYLHHGHFTSSGDVLTIRSSNERFHRIIGVLEHELDCQPFDYFYEREKTAQAINVEIYLQWIEKVVWGNRSCFS